MTKTPLARKYLNAENLRENEIQTVISIPLGEVSVSDTSAVATTTHYRQVKLTDNLLNHAKAAYFEFGNTTGATDGTQEVQLYDETAASVVASNSGSPLSVSQWRSADILSSLTEGNNYDIRCDVTAGSATAQTLDAEGRIIIVLGVS